MTRMVLDITRTVSRIGRGLPTGIDRVEHAYIHALSDRDPQAMAFARLGKTFVTVPLSLVAGALSDLLAGTVPLRPGMQDALRLKLPPAQRRARAFLRRHALGRGSRPGAALGGARIATYVNVGHTNLDTATLNTLRDHGARVWVMVHDLIPLDFPQYTRPGIAKQFETRMRAVATCADRIICNSAATAARVADRFGAWGRVPEIRVAHLGVEPAGAVHAPQDPPRFVTLGTIEPRKNHALLLDVWDTLPDPKPELRIIGRRGWMNESVFARLDAGPAGVTELPGIDDTALWSELAGARALLFPSLVEGYGLPALEAAQIGLPVICSDLAVFRELLGSYATYLDPQDVTAWRATVARVAQSPVGGQNVDRSATATPAIPSWDSHFRHVFLQD